MANIVYLTHRLPYPPNKGDKVRSYHVLKHLAARHRVFLGTFVDDPEDEEHIGAATALCVDAHVARVRPRIARASSLAALSNGESLTTRYYRDAGLQRWVDSTCAFEGIDAAVVFSSSMAQYIPTLSRVPMLVDFVDVDSAKWNQYASTHGWPLSWLYRREGVLLLAFERATAARSRRSFFVTENESALFRSLAPECSSRISTLCNGVDSDFFKIDATRASPFGSNRAPEGSDRFPVVFTGAMDYWPNIDAVTWFAKEVLPSLRDLVPEVRFHVVGRNPPNSIRSLASEVVEVTGTVPDVRPYLQHAAVVVAPLRIARGVQNKILEAMSMGRPVVASAACAQGIEAQPDAELISAVTPSDFVRRIALLLRNPEQAEMVGLAGRRCVLRNYSWDANLAHLDNALAAVPNFGLAA